MGKIVYATGNYGKYISVKEQFEENGIDIDFLEHDFDEPNVNDIELVSKTKVLETYSILGKPCFVADTGFYIDDYPNNPGYPGALVKRSGISSNINDLLETMKNSQNRSCQYVDCLTFYDGKDFYTFYGVSKGTIAFEPRGSQTKKAKSNLWYVLFLKIIKKHWQR
ncbi:MAG: non-canonical purine NTP pyrophosphatase [Bacilli bacterium]|nr:non-canonical purine NTP pyrophosphatase [Bacilli bacterium]